MKQILILLPFLALLMAITIVSGVETVDVSGDYGQSWINKNPYQATTSNSDESGLWNWGGTPKGHEVVNGSLQLINTSDYNMYPYLPVSYDSLRAYSYYSGGSFYSDDPWVLAQHYGVTVRTDWDDLPKEIQDTIDLPDDYDDYYNYPVGIMY